MSIYQYQYVNQENNQESDWCETKALAKDNFISKYGEESFQDAILKTKPRGT